MSLIISPQNLLMLIRLSLASFRKAAASDDGSRRKTTSFGTAVRFFITRDLIAVPIPSSLSQ
jgi:hypothetical protein